MAIRQLRFVGDPVLRKKSRKIENINDRLLTLLDDMVDTMYKEDGIGLAAPQIGILKRAVVIDIGEGPIKLINPEIIEQKGESIDVEGCLSIPDESGMVKRPERVKVKYMDINGEDIIIETDGLLARALCHEIDHLDGVLYIDKLEKEEE
ncbi:peptide deformylase [Clostridium sp. D2Q-11]|uniref:Peptide deformylase n=1 Tax=Anaeromonas frigoriresistens TaxID=2683708 RepID=A0A942ZAF4_9FIRM|nr:peptide deformylase [Anaeromonas frigoriresistens]MBS4539735.1 peptide deformylase [Anaeromonas frigoriresistens]